MIHKLSLLATISTIMTISSAAIIVEETLPDVAYNSSDTSIPILVATSITFDSFSDGKKKASVNFKKISNQEHVTISSQWSVNDWPLFSYDLDDFAPSTTEYIDTNGQPMISFSITSVSAIPWYNLRNNFKLQVEFVRYESLFFVKEKREREFYSHISYEIRFFGSLDLPNTLVYELDPVDYFIKKEIDGQHYSGRFTLPDDKTSTIHWTFANIWGFNTSETPPKSYDTFDQIYLHWLSAEERLPMDPDNFQLKPWRRLGIIHTAEVTPKNQEFYMKLSNNTLADNPGILKLSVWNQHPYFINNEVTFDLTSYLYDGLDYQEPLFPYNALTMGKGSAFYTDKYYLFCDAQGPRNVSARFYRQLPGSEYRVELTQDVVKTSNFYSASSFLLFVGERKPIKGAIYCVVTGEYNGTTHSIEYNYCDNSWTRWKVDFCPDS